MPRKPRKKKPLNARRVKNWVLSFLGLAIIIFAITFTVARFAIKTVPDYIADLQTVLSKQTGFDVRIGVLDAEINWLVPRLNLINVNVFDPQGTRHVLHLDTIDFSLDWVSSLRTRSLVVGEISLSGLNAELTVNQQSQLLFEDYVISENIDRMQDASSGNAIFQLSERMRYLLNNLDFRIVDSQLRFTDFRRTQKPKVFSHFNLHLMNQGDQHMIELKAELPKNFGRYLRLVAQAEGDLFDYKNLQGKLQLSLENIVAAAWLDEYWGELGIAANADLSADIWLAWQGAQLNDLYSRFSLQDAALHYLDNEVRSWQMESLAGELWWRNTSDGWALDVRDLQAIRGNEVWPKSTAFNLQYKDSQHAVSLSADFMRVESMVYLADMLNSAAIVENSWFNLLTDYQPSGDVKYLQLTMQLDNADSLQFNADFDRVSFKLPQFEPSAVDNLRGAIEYQDNNAKLKLHSSESRLHFNRLFRDSMQITQLSGELDLQRQRQGNGWQISSEYLRMHTPHIESQSRFIVSLPEDAPAFMDLTTRYQNGNAEFISRYLPASIMRPNTLDWIDRSILSGRIVQGGYQFYGNLRDMPFRSFQGVSLAVFDVEQAKLNYQKNWPQIDGIDAHLRFENESIQIDAKRGQLLDSKIKQARVEISNFRQPVLQINGTIDADLADIGKFFNDSPLHKTIPGYFDNVLLQGEGELALQLRIPLKGKQRVNWSGVLKPAQAKLTLQRENYQFDQLNGELKFADGLFETDDLRARLGEHELAIAVKPTDVQTKQHQITINGVMDINQFLSPLPMAHDYLSGASHWQVDIDLSPTQILHQPSLNLRASSQLESVLSSLPGPLAKSSASALPVELQLRVMPDQKMQLELQLADDRMLRLNELNDDWALDIAAPSIKGRAIINKQSSMAHSLSSPLDINLQYLNLQQFIDTGQKIDQTVTAGQKQTVESSVSQALHKIKPGDIPSVNLTIGQLLWDNYVFRDVHLSTTQTRNAMMIKTLKLSTDHYDLSSEGSWQSSWSQQHTTHLKSQIKLHNLGAALKALDITEDIENTRGVVDLDLRWNDKPYAFSWIQLNGSGRLALKNGVLSKINAGPARMLGLFNLKTVLSLDFGSQLAEGFAFDQAGGSFSISKGNIYSDNLSIESKVADVFLRGRLDMQKKTVDQTIRVRPHVGSSVAFGTTVVAGPAAGGLVYLLQKMFTPDKLSEYEYRVTGSLQKPQVTLLSAPKAQGTESGTGAADEF